MPRPLRKVVLLIETSREYGRGLLRGIMRYQHERGPWSLYFQPRALGEPPPPWLSRWHGDGILVRADTWPLARAVLRTGVPAVDLRVSLPGLPLPFVGIDNQGIVDLAFGHLREQGFRHYAFCGLPPGENMWVDYRCEHFVRLAEAGGFACGVYPEPRRRRHPTWEREQDEIGAWLHGLPKPVGVMACNDERGLQVVDACRRLGLHVPDKVAVIGVDNDEFSCNLSSPPLSSVEVGVERAGYEAAALLDYLMAGKKPERAEVYLPPLGVVARASSDTAAVDDPELARLIRFVRDHACDGLRVEDIWEQTDLSPSTLQRRFRQQLGRSPKEEILRVQLERAKSLLLFSDLAVAEIAQRCGFANAKHLSTIFHAKVGRSPSAFRDAERRRGANRQSGEGQRGRESIW